jgi:hypothetical protein
MITRYDRRYNRFAGLPLFAPPDDDDDDDDKGKGKGGGKGGGDDDDKTDWKAEAERWRRDARRHEEAAKTNKGAADRLAELENASKSDLDKMTARAEAAEGKLATLERDLLRTRVALRKGLNETQAKRLVGDNEQEMEDDADELLETFGGGGRGADDRNDNDRDRDRNGRNGSDRNGGGGGGNRPRENLRPGSRPESKPEELDPIKLAESVPRGGIG